MTSKISVRVDNDSAALDHRADRIMREYAHDVEREVSDFAHGQILKELDLVLKHPTGYYESRVRVRQVGDLFQVDDSGVVYGPWLAGESERNRETRFKGYRHWQLAQANTDRAAEPIAEQAFRKYARRLS
ncbi:hypothetical protein ACFWB2_14685 [Streptomyces virginiae]|uniref:hypothetical protein n=1 Tax=Streptomyces TaxID=1883 RepID=UPI00093BE6A8|nr:hypothetical protein [Streptomyces sp. MJM1172]OKI67566.1 hypothetical protein AMK15_06240 [Streptomyces sp. MJM1172]